MSGDRVLYNGTEMAAGWPARIEAAQKIREYVIGGIAYERIPYGGEQSGGELPEACRDCGVLLGQYHVEFVCDGEECPQCHGQVIGCDCPYEDDQAAVLTEKRQDLAPANWQDLLNRVEPEISGYTVSLETASGRFVPLASKPQDENVVGLVITYIRDGISPWETEQPIKQLAERLSARFGMEPLVLLSRSLESFVGYYLRIRP